LIYALIDTRFFDHILRGVDMAGSRYPDDGFDLAAELRRRGPELRAQQERAQRNFRHTADFPQRVKQASTRVRAERAQLAKQAADLLKARGHPASHPERIVVSVSGGRTFLGGYKKIVVHEPKPIMVWWVSESEYLSPPPESDIHGKYGSLERQGHALSEDGLEFKITTHGLQKFEPSELRASDDRDLEIKMNERREEDKSFFLAFLARDRPDEFLGGDFWKR
jgi:hypothetical protein